MNQNPQNTSPSQNTQHTKRTQNPKNTKHTKHAQNSQNPKNASPPQNTSHTKHIHHNKPPSPKAHPKKPQKNTTISVPQTDPNTSNNLIAKKSLSQNFLIDKNITHKMIDLLQIEKDDVVLEIGPGKGALTNELIKKAKKVIAIEKDVRFERVLNGLDSEKLDLRIDDFLKVDLEFLKEFKKVKVISSIPYNISTKIILRLMQNFKLFSKVVLLMQKEVALKASPKGNNFDKLYYLTNTLSNVKLEKTVSQNCFFPKPKVLSAIVSFERKDMDINPIKLVEFLNIIFFQKRKKLINQFSKKFDKNFEDIFLKLNIDKNIRSENLSLDQFLALYKKAF